LLLSINSYLDGANGLGSCECGGVVRKGANQSLTRLGELVTGCILEIEAADAAGTVSA
jgi:ribosomal protein S8E